MLDVSELKAGDHIRATFQELPPPKTAWLEGRVGQSLVLPTGKNYTIDGDVLEFVGSLGPGLQISTNGQCLRQHDGSPGDWLVSFEILKKGNA